MDPPSTAQSQVGSRFLHLYENGAVEQSLGMVWIMPQGGIQVLQANLTFTRISFKFVVIILRVE